MSATPPCGDPPARTYEPELQKRHLALNVERYLGLGTFRNRKGTFNADWSTLCMKAEHKFAVSQLLKMPPLNQRGLPNIKAEVSFRARPKHLTKDANGNMVPYGPGTCTLLTELDPGHHALAFIKSRDYDPAALVAQMRASYCDWEIEEDATCGRWYRRMPEGWKDTPQGRVVFFGDMEGRQEIWQARVMEMVAGEHKLFWHPYRQAWVPVQHLVEGKWELLPEYADQRYKWDPSKYKTAQDAARNQSMIGLDAAIAWNKASGRNDVAKAVCILSEGPLDAARFMAPGIAILGKHLSDNQARILSRFFGTVLVAMDNDASGQKALARAQEVLAGKCRVVQMAIPGHVKPPARQG